MAQFSRWSVWVAALALAGTVMVSTTDAEARRRTIQAEVTMAQGTDRSVSVVGEGVVRVAPDRATVTMVFRKRAEALTDAHTMVQQDLQRFMEAVEAAGFNRDIVRNGGLRYHPEYAYPSGSGPKLVGFNAQMTVVLRIDDIQDVPRVMELALAAGADELNPVAYSVSNLEEKRREARAIAMNAARTRAQELAEGFDAQLGHVLTISEAQYYDAQPRFARQEMAVMDSAQAGSGESFAQIDPDAVEVRATITANFGLK